MIKSRSIILTFLAFALFGQVRSQEDLGVLNYWKYHNAPQHLLYGQLMGTAQSQLNKRKQNVAQLAGKEAWRKRQREIAQLLKKIAGDFPAKTPLNPVITGKLERDGVQVEKLYFESRPGYYVTAALFKPANATGKLPAIVYCSGHSANGFRVDTYQTVMLNYAKKGFAVLAFDPIGQGERVQYPKVNGKARFGPTHEHSYPGSLSFVSGLSPANYFIWDGIRAVDYLISRTDIDPSRIGIAGRSGGGTQSAYIAAMDERILAAAPECYLTSFDMLLRSKGPQDAEQLFMHGIARGFDLADLVEVRAPKPTMIVTTTRDIFSIEGARNLYDEALKAYQAAGSKDNLQMVEDDAVHASTLKNREATYTFFRKFLKNPGNATEEPVKLFTEQELYVTQGGNVYNELKGDNLYTLSRDHAKAKIASKTTLTNFAALQKAVMTATNYQTPKATSEAIFSGRLNREGYDIDKYMIKGTADHFLPMLWMKPKTASVGAVLLLDEKGKAEAAQKDGLADRLLSAGFEVIVADLTGMGELSNIGLPGGDAFIEDVRLNLWYLGILTNKSLVGCRMEEMKILIDFVKKKLTGGRALSLIATGVVGSDALQTAMIGADLLDKKVLIGSLGSFASLYKSPDYRPKYLFSAAAGSLPYYDLPDLAAVQKAGSLLIIAPVSGDGKYLSADEVQEQFANAKGVSVEGGAVPQNPALADRLIRFLKP